MAAFALLVVLSFLFAALPAQPQPRASKVGMVEGSVDPLILPSVAAT